ncbi:hypothetical protein ACC794_02890 [Rhizobium ruizarguesonis]
METTLLPKAFPKKEWNVYADELAMRTGHEKLVAMTSFSAVERWLSIADEVGERAFRLLEPIREYLTTVRVVTAIATAGYEVALENPSDIALVLIRHDQARFRIVYVNENEHRYFWAYQLPDLNAPEMDFRWSGDEVVEECIKFVLNYETWFDEHHWKEPELPEGAPPEGSARME